jgi:hypothetical protein
VIAGCYLSIGTGYLPNRYDFCGLTISGGTIMPEEGVLIVYGRGDKLGNFKLFADDLVTTELTSFKRQNVVIKNVERRNAFFDLLNSPPFAFKIKELHIYAHSIGAGLFLAYGDPALQHARSTVADRARGGTATYLRVLNTEIGTIFTDDLIRSPYKDYRTRIRTHFSNDAKIKIWGCNSGIANWAYSDVDSNGNYVYDLNAPASSYYWRALNEQNIPKPSIAQAFANYFQVETYGATSGSSIQVRHQGRWMSSPEFLRATRRRVVNEQDVLRLAPDRGVYNEYRPQ